MSNLARPTFALLLILGLAACASPRERRIAANPQIYQSLSTSDQVLVQQGRIREGMSKEGVFLALGRPDGVAAGRQKGVNVEQWTYMGSQPVYTTTVGMGWGWGGAWGLRGRGCGYVGPWDPYWMGGPMVTYVPYKAATVTFRGNRVTDYLTGPQ
ncbi:MAG: hypothetical protein LDL31_06635 [Prosthecobacter sp.]|jgi:hypothetical protein|nr:hypothetical protein [Prosthecobacter sp.]